MAQKFIVQCSVCLSLEKILLDLHIYLKIICLELTSVCRICRHWIWRHFSTWHRRTHEALNAVEFLGWLKRFGPAQKILWPVKGQGSSLQILIWLQTDKFTFDQMQSYQTSVVERECVEGIINTDYVTKYTTLAFLRKIDDINMSDTRGGKYFLDPFCCF